MSSFKHDTCMLNRVIPYKLIKGLCNLLFIISPLIGISKKKLIYANQKLPDHDFNVFSHSTSRLVISETSKIDLLLSTLHLSPSTFDTRQKPRLENVGWRHLCGRHVPQDFFFFANLVHKLPFIASHACVFSS